MRVVASFFVKFLKVILILASEIEEMSESSTDDKVEFLPKEGTVRPGENPLLAKAISAARSLLACVLNAFLLIFECCLNNHAQLSFDPLNALEPRS